MSAPLTVGGRYGRVGVEILRGSECVAVVGRMQANRLAHLDTVRSATAKRGEQAHYAEAEAQGLEAGWDDALALARKFAAAEDLIEAAKDAAREWRLHGQLTDSCRVLEAAIARAESR